MNPETVPFRCPEQDPAQTPCGIPPEGGGMQKTHFGVGGTTPQLEAQVRCGSEGKEKATQTQVAFSFPVPGTGLEPARPRGH
jgi:hypothetical protein